MRKISFIYLVLTLCCALSFAQLNKAKAEPTKAKVVFKTSGPSVSLTCNASGVATGFNFYRATGSCPAGSYTRLGTSPMSLSCSYTDTSVSPGTTYCYVATELNSLNQESGYSNTAQAVVPGLPTVTGVAPPTGAAAGGTSVTITGTNFVSGATVTFGGVAAISVVFVSSTSITATTPAGTGAVAVIVTNPDGSNGSLANAFTYIALPNPPTGLTVGTITAGNVPLNWLPPVPENGLILASFTVYRAPKAGMTNPQKLASVPATTTSYVDSTCTSKCFYKVEAMYTVLPNYSNIVGPVTP